ncbi:hypothetical protein ACFL6I_11205 [candidate division KSB1 bacterium]
MAKKKKGKHKADKPASTKKDNTLLYGLGVVILIIIIIILIRSGKDQAGPADIEVTPTEDVPVEPVEEAPELEGVMEEYSCSVGAAIGYKACNALGNGDVELVVLHQGMDTLTGAQYYIYDENGDLIAEAAEMGVVEGGAEATYTLPLSEYPDAKKVEVRPVVNIDGADSICVNQRVVVIPSTSCR